MNATPLKMKMIRRGRAHGARISNDGRIEEVLHQQYARPAKAADAPARRFAALTRASPRPAAAASGLS